MRERTVIKNSFTELSLSFNKTASLCLNFYSFFNVQKDKVRTLNLAFINSKGREIQIFLRFLQ